MAPPTRAARRTWAASRISRAGSASVGGAPGAAREERIAADAAAAAAAAAAAVAAARATITGEEKLRGLSVMDAWTVLLVDAEYERCRNTNGRFRRLIPSSRAARHLCFVEEGRSRNRLPFDSSGEVVEEEEVVDPVKQALQLASTLAASSFAAAEAKADEEEAKTAAVAAAAAGLVCPYPLPPPTHRK
uniref:Uncharacterized protein n=1 Tax=Haptolina brevifila TaxID=156173 RepID=A0A7S2JH59_9EUKA|mmetsp:Transcript_82405/g.164260  ORF Transcript_82405/g.164260 Transcript_82405/m.164260 type:complete len:189 (+) Transcript_82405:713-1279(+)